MAAVERNDRVYQRDDFERIGLAFCSGFRREAKMLSEIFEAHGIELISVMCKTGGIDKTAAGVPEEYKLKPGQFEAHCNPIAQGIGLKQRRRILTSLWVSASAMTLYS